MIYRKNSIYLAIICFIFLFLAISYKQSDSTLKRMEQDVLASNELGVYKGNIAEDFQLLNLKGQQITLKNLRGKKVMINFFATWCAPCQEEIPILVDLHKKIKDDKLVILSINVTKEEPNPNNVRKFVEHFNAKFDVLYDGDGQVMKEYQLIGIPTTLFIDTDGKIVDRINGIITPEMIKNHSFFKDVL